MQSSQIQAYLLGDFQLVHNQFPLPLPSRQSARTLLTYLLLHRSPQPRAQLAALLAPDEPENRARRRLTQALWEIRQSLPLNIVQATGDAIYIPLDAPLWVDAAQFEAWVRPFLASDPLPAAAIPDLYRALALYRGDLLPGFYDDWVLLRQEHLREQYLHALAVLSRWEKGNGRFQPALTLTLRLIQADPLREAAHREAMRLYAALGRLHAAHQQYEICHRTLADELGITPQPETIALAQAIARQTGDPDPLYLPTPAGLPPALQPGASLPLVGRTEERAALLRCLTDALDGQGGVALLAGEPGIGKSRLLQELAADARWRGAVCSWGQCTERGTFSPYAPLLQALNATLTPLRVRQLRALLADLWLAVAAPLLPAIPTALPDLPPPPPLPSEQENGRLENGRLLESLTRLILALGQMGPHLILLEDVHWADPATLDVLVYLCRRLAAAPVLIVASFRPEEAQASTAVWDALQALDMVGARSRLTLAALDPTATAELIRQGLGLHRRTPLFSGRLHHQSGGNPLFVLETLRTLHDEGQLFQDAAGEWHTPFDSETNDYAELLIPDISRELLARRLARLDEAAQQTLYVAAVIGPEIDFTLLQAANSAANQLAARQTLTAVALLIQRQFLVETPENYRFSHDLVHQAAYQAVPTDLRPQLHRQVAGALAAAHPTNHARLAYHFTQGEVWDTAVTRHMQAGAQARAVYAMQSALAHYDQALALLDAYAPLPAAQNARARFDALAARCALRSSPNDLAALRQLAAELGDPQRQIQAHLQTAVYHTETSGEYVQAQSAGEAALALAQEHGLQREIAQAWQAIGHACQRAEQLQAAVQALRQSLALWDTLSEPGQEAWETQLRLAQTLEHMGALAQASAACQSLLTHLNPADDPLLAAHAGNLQGNLAYYDGQYEVALTHYQTSLERFQAVGLREYEARMVGNMGNIHWTTGRYGAALALIGESLTIFTELGSLKSMHIAHLNLAGLYMDVGRLDEALAHNAQALALARQLRIQDSLAQALESRVHILLYQGQVAKIRPLLDEAQSLADSLEWAYIRGLVALAWGAWHQAQGQDAAAISFLQQSDEILRQAGIEEYAAAACSFRAWSLARLGQVDEALALSETAVAYVQTHEGGAYIFDIFNHRRLILQMAGQPTGELVTAVHALLEARAAALSDAADRERFRTGLPAVRDLYAAYAAQRGQPCTVVLPRVDAVGGRPLRPDEQIAIIWTPHHPDDEAIAHKGPRRQQQILRLLTEAANQGAAPTIAHLAEAVAVSPGTIKRDLAALRRDGHNVHTRGG